jgi:hypothetical protein
VGGGGGGGEAASEWEARRTKSEGREALEGVESGIFAS